jgi:hypothetical protein
MSNKINFFCLLSILFQLACEKETVIETKETGSISGTVKLYDDKSSTLIDASGVSVSVIGMAGKTSITGFDGKFTIDSLPFDNYDLLFSKTGYGTFKIFGIEHVRQPIITSGSNSVTQLTRVVNMGLNSTSAVISLNSIDLTYNDAPGIEYSYSLSPAPNTNSRGYVRAFLGKKHTTSSSEYISYSNVKSAVNNPTKGGFTAEELYGMGFNPGDSVYVKLYGDSFISNIYTDPNSGITVFPNLNASSPAPIFFIAP